MIDTLCDQARIEDIAIASLYYDFLAQQEQTITNVVGAILRQLVACWGDIPIYLSQPFQEGKKEMGGRGLRLADLMGMLRIAIALLPQVFICIDALDECLQKYLPELLKSLRDIVRECPRTRIFLTGRPYRIYSLNQLSWIGAWRSCKGVCVPVPRDRVTSNDSKMKKLARTI